MKGAKQAPLIVYVALLSVGLLCGVLTGSQIGVLREARFTTGSENCETPEAPQPGPFVLAIKVQIKPELREEWLQQWKVLGKHVKENEPNTLAYEVLEIEGQENTFLVYERYCTKSDLHDPHQQSEPFKRFKEWCTQTDPYVGKEGYGAYETKIGFMSK